VPMGPFIFSPQIATKTDPDGLRHAQAPLGGTLRLKSALTCGRK
jgi:hypothetical protein